MKIFLDANMPPSIMLYSALIGSASGVIISQITDYLKLKKQHKLNLQKEFFSKKLDVFEKTVAFWTNTQSIIQGLEMAIKSALNPDHYFNEQTSDNIMSSMTKEYYDINNASKVLASSLRLYTDIPSEHYFSNSIVEYFNAYGELGQLIQSFSDNQVSEQQFKNEVDVRMKKQEVLSKRINEKASDLINLLRLELKQFDY